MRNTGTIIAVFTLALASATLASAQTTAPEKPEPVRSGIWFNAGLGVGSLGCDNCDGDRDTGLSGTFALGGTLNQHVVLGVGTSGYTETVFGERLTVGTLEGRVRVYPGRRSGFFLNGGLGLGHLHFVGESEYGLGLTIGAGWDIRVSRNVSITPFYNGFAMRNSNADANVGQLGVGITIH